MNVELPVLFPIHAAIALPKTYFEILPIVSVDNVTVTVAGSVVLSAKTEIGILAVLGAKSSKKQFVFCAKTARFAQINKLVHNMIILLFIFPIALKVLKSYK
jgi:hypothetical protein